MHPPSFFCNRNNTENHSKHPHHLQAVHYMEDHQPIVRSLVFQQQQKPIIFTNDDDRSNYLQPASLIVVPHDENSNLNMQSNMKKSSTMACNNNNINSGGHVVVEGKRMPPSKRSFKKDRHSKIDTARGPRDRRMRLSLDVAKKFFRLQDMLGFDKASNTIEWLIMKSKPAIRDLLSQHSNQGRYSLIGVINSAAASSGSECCEVLSDIDEHQSLDKTGDQDQVISVADNAKLTNFCRTTTNNKEKKKVDRGIARKSVYIDHTLAKETREKARARARKRTSEKRNIVKFGGDDQYTARLRPTTTLDKVIDQNTNRLGSWVPFGANHQVHTTDHQQPAPEYHNPISSSHIQFKQGIAAAAGESSSSVMMLNNWTPASSLFNYHNNNPGSSHDQRHFRDFQIQGKPWAAGTHNNN